MNKRVLPIVLVACAFSMQISLCSPCAAGENKGPAIPSKKPKPSGQTKVIPGAHLNTPEVNSYLGRLQGRLQNNWYLVDGRNKVTITATIAADGATSDIQVSSSPSNTEAEQAANEAFAKAQPLESLPRSAGSQVKLTILFDSFADPHGDTDRHISTTLDPIRSAAESAKPPQ